MGGKIPGYGDFLNIRQATVPRTPLLRSNFGGLDAPGKAMEQAGQNLQDVSKDLAAEVQRREKDRDNLLLLERQNLGADELHPILYDPENGEYSKKGRDALGGRERLQKASKEIKERLLDGLPDALKTTMEYMWDRQLQPHFSALSRRALQGAETWKQNQLDATVAVSLRDAVAGGAESEVIAYHLDRGQLAIQAKHEGQAEEFIKTKKAEFRSEAHANIIEAILQNDPESAQAYFEEKKGDMLPSHEARAEAGLDKARYESRIDAGLRQVQSMFQNVDDMAMFLEDEKNRKFLGLENSAEALQVLQRQKMFEDLQRVDFQKQSGEAMKEIVTANRDGELTRTHIDERKHNLTAAHLETAYKMLDAVGPGGAIANPDKAIMDYFKQAIPNGDDPEQVFLFSKAFAMEVESFEQTHKRKAVTADKYRIADELFTIVEDHWLDRWDVYKYQMPDKARRWLMQHGKPVTPENIQDVIDNWRWLHGED